jgi:hypothetical protein
MKIAPIEDALTEERWKQIHACDNDHASYTLKIPRWDPYYNHTRLLAKVLSETSIQLRNGCKLFINQERVWTIQCENAVCSYLFICQQSLVIITPVLCGRCGMELRPQTAMGTGAVPVPRQLTGSASGSGGMGHWPWQLTITVVSELDQVVEDEFCVAATCG